MAEKPEKLKKSQQLQQLQQQADDVETGMLVEATKGDLGTDDVSKAKVTKVIRDETGHTKEIIVDKGILFKKELEIPSDRIQSVEHKPEHGAPAAVNIDADALELNSLSATGHEQLVTEEEFLKQAHDEDSLLEEIEEAIPTAEGLRELEAESTLAQTQAEVQAAERATTSKISWLRLLGPGFLGGMAGNDASAVAAYSIDGVQNGFGHLWLLLLATPLYQATMFTCAKIARVTKKGLAEVLREHYGRWIASIAALILIIANIALIAADLVAVSAGFELITHINWVWFIVPIAVILWYLTVYRNFESIKRIFIIMSLAFVAYFVTALLAKPNWGDVLLKTLIPHIDLNFASVSSAVALLGATISPYNIFWQEQGEKEEKRPGKLLQDKLRLASLDIGIGVISGNLIAYFIIISTATTLFAEHKNIATAADAAQALTPVLGPFAGFLFAIGLIGAGLVAIPVLLASTSYAVAGTFGWPVGLSKKPWQDEGFYLILTVSLVASLMIALIRIDPIRLLFWANVLGGVLAPFLVVLLLLIGNNRKIMGKQRLSIFTNSCLVLAFLVMAIAAVLLFYGLATGQGG